MNCLASAPCVGLTCSMMSLTLSCSQSRITRRSFLFSRSWKRERYASSFRSSFKLPTLMAVTCHFLSAAVSSTTCSVVKPAGGWVGRWSSCTSALSGFLPVEIPTVDLESGPSNVLPSSKDGQGDWLFVWHNGGVTKTTCQTARV